METYDEVVNAIFGAIRNILDNNDDEYIELRSSFFIDRTREELLRQFPVDELVENFELSGITPVQMAEQLDELKEKLFYSFSDFKVSYEDSPVKIAFIDMFYSMLENFIDSVNVYSTAKVSSAIGVELIHPNAKIPTYAHEGDQGADVYAIEDVILPPHSYGTMIPTGIKLLIPEGWAISIRPRSGLSKNSTLRISNSPATIDQKYRGEVKILFDNIGDEPVTIKAGERIAQMILEKNFHSNFKQIDSVDIDDSERGEGGFGSSGK